MEKKSILFISSLDFKEKSIQVVKKTVEYYVKKNFNVYFVTVRDSSKRGDYYYEKEINPENVIVIRNKLTFSSIRSISKNKYWTIILNHICGYSAIISLFINALRVHRKQKFDYIYGFTEYGIIVARLLKIFSKNSTKFIHRMLGTFYLKLLAEKAFLKLFFNWRYYLPMHFNSDLFIMTDDGTQGNLIMKKIKSPSLKNFLFLPNGVDIRIFNKQKEKKIIENYSLQGKNVFISISRLVSWKRVDRSIYVFHKLINTMGLENLILLIVGDGEKRNDLEQLVKSLNLTKFVIFTGPVENNDIPYYLNISNFFFSFYEGSNVGNPLLEAIRYNKVIFTIKNGSTEEWIINNKNGFIFEEDENLIQNIAKQVSYLLSNNDLVNNIISEICKTEKLKLYTWDERLQVEYEHVTSLMDDI